MPQIHRRFLAFPFQETQDAKSLLAERPDHLLVQWIYHWAIHKSGKLPGFKRTGHLLRMFAVLRRMGHDDLPHQIRKRLHVKIVEVQNTTKRAQHHRSITSGAKPLSLLHV